MGVRYEVKDGESLTIAGPCSVMVIGDPGVVPEIGAVIPVAAKQSTQQRENKTARQRAGE